MGIGVIGSDTERGLSLVEVLIASVIFFSLIAIAAESYLTSVASARRADAVIAALAPMPLVIDRVRDDLGRHPLGDHSGEGVMLGVRYSYRASIATRGGPSPELATDIGAAEGQNDRFVIYDVDLSLESDGRSLKFKYQEFAW